MKLIAIPLLVLIFSLDLAAQRDQGGFILPEDSILDQYSHERVLFIPKKGVIYYETPNGKYEGKIWMGLPSNAPGATILTSKDSAYSASIGGAYLRPHKLDLSTFFETSDNRFHISFDKQEDGFVRILSDSYIGWVSIKELNKSGFKLMYWMDYYGSAGNTIVPPNNTKIPLRTSPYNDAQILTLLHEDYYEIQVIAYDEEGNTCEGQFCNVRATQFKIHPCFGGDYNEENVIEIFEGWIRLVDNEGKRLMFHNPWGC